MLCFNTNSFCCPYFFLISLGRMIPSSRTRAWGAPLQAAHPAVACHHGGVFAEPDTPARAHSHSSARIHPAPGCDPASLAEQEPTFRCKSVNPRWDELGRPLRIDWEHPVGTGRARPFQGYSSHPHRRLTTGGSQSPHILLPSLWPAGVRMPAPEL